MTAQAHAHAHAILKPLGQVSLVTTTPRDPDRYYRMRSGLYVWDDFRSRILANAKPTAPGAKYDLTISGLAVASTDAEIEAALGSNHLFDESAVCAIIAAIIGKQANGESGNLENTGYANLFYTGPCVVNMYWDGGYREWDVCTWERDDGRWRVGDRVFSSRN